ncbi:hypothetical protein CU098_013207, partial [Rhizopus stolonifer]
MVEGINGSNEIRGTMDTKIIEDYMGHKAIRYNVSDGRNFSLDTENFYQEWKNSSLIEGKSWSNLHSNMEEKCNQLC